jgi:glucosamine--fructose-6-phosphate aminotransferase (isomerizing)
VHGEGVEAGELKHGFLSLVNERFPTIALCPRDSVYEKMVSNIQEITARRGPVIAIATEGDSAISGIADEVIFIPDVLEPLAPLLSAVVLHLFSYYLALARGCEIDQPRNLAKSVTVE